MCEYCKRFLQAIAEGGVQRLTSFRTGEEAICRDGRLLCGRNIQDPDLVEDIQMEPHLVLFGCGHVGKALYNLAELQDLKVTVLDCREDLLTEGRFPKAERISGPYDQLLSREYGFVAPYYCIFTHGHRYDEKCLLYALRHPHSYIGMIGSKAKIAHCLESIRAKGITEDMLQKLHTPIGLPINAVTPEEIAVAIMAQIISVFRFSRKVITVDANVLRKASEEHGIMVRIVEKSGSSPRSVGSMMFITENDMFGTIGGGAIENHAIEKARQMLRYNEPFLLEQNDLTDSGQLGMICGGETTLLYRMVD